MLFLPEFYGIEFSQSFPLITAKRIMCIIFYIYALLNRKRGINAKSFNIKTISHEYWLLFGYFFFRIISNLYYAKNYSTSITTIFSLIFEQLLILIAIYALTPSYKVFISIVKAIVFTATILFIVGIYESFTFSRPFANLFTVSRSLYYDYYVRLGLLRSTTTFTMSNFYGNMCLLVTPLIFFLHQVTGQRKYLLIILLDILAIIHSGCRSDMLFFIFIALLYILSSLKNNGQFNNIVKNASIIGIILVAWTSLLSIISVNYRYFYLGTLKSLLNVIGFNFDLNANAPNGTGGYGTNELGVGSRTFQFSGIKYALSQNPLFGLGTGCQIRGDIQYFYLGKWRAIRTIDMGIVEILCSEGIIGLIGYAFLFSFIILVLIQIIKQKTILKDELVMIILMVLSYLLSTLSTSNMMPFLILICSYFVNKKGAINRMTKNQTA